MSTENQPAVTGKGGWVTSVLAKKPRTLIVQNFLTALSKVVFLSCFHNRAMNTAGVETPPGTAWRRPWLRWMELNTVSSNRFLREIVHLLMVATGDVSWGDRDTESSPAVLQQQGFHSRCLLVTCESCSVRCQELGASSGGPAQSLFPIS